GPASAVVAGGDRDRHLAGRGQAEGIVVVVRALPAGRRQDLAQRADGLGPSRHARELRRVVERAAQIRQLPTAHGVLDRVLPEAQLGQTATYIPWFLTHDGSHQLSFPGSLGSQSAASDFSTSFEGRKQEVNVRAL